MRASTLSKIQVVLDNMNTNQRIIATQIMKSGDYSFIERNGMILIKTKKGELVEFLGFIRNKCNCG
jgi:hypothetical protein